MTTQHSSLKQLIKEIKGIRLLRRPSPSQTLCRVVRVLSSPPRSQDRCDKVWEESAWPVMKMDLINSNTTNMLDLLSTKVLWSVNENQTRFYLSLNLVRFSNWVFVQLFSAESQKKHFKCRFKKYLDRQKIFVLFSSYRFKYCRFEQRHELWEIIPSTFLLVSQRKPGMSQDCATL